MADSWQAAAMTMPQMLPRTMRYRQNAPSSPTSTDDNLYDGSGTRVEQQSVVSGTTTSSVYVGNLEEVDTSGTTTTTTVS